jgi:Ca2+-binding EF-hand superfamily protein
MKKVISENCNHDLHFFYKGNDEEHIGYCFDIYDLNGDGMISREEMLTMLKTSLGRQGLDEDPDEGVKVRTLISAWL